MIATRYFRFVSSPRAPAARLAAAVAIRNVRRSKPSDERSCIRTILAVWGRRRRKANVRSGYCTPPKSEKQPAQSTQHAGACDPHAECPDVKKRPQRPRRGAEEKRKQRT